MARHNTVFAQLLKLVSRHEFEQQAKQHREGRKLRKPSRWSQFVSLMAGQLAGRSSLRDIDPNMKARAQRLYHLGVTPVARASLARLNEHQPHTLMKHSLTSCTHAAKVLRQGIAFVLRTNCILWIPYSLTCR